jgi:hypothetical protein
MEINYFGGEERRVNLKCNIKEYVLMWFELG